MSDVLFERAGRLARIRLNRPKAIHALTRAMCVAMSEQLLAWRDDADIEAVLIDHAEGRGFCAGGDVVLLATSGAGDGAEAAAFFFDEYRLNHLLFTYPKPVIAVIDGITMGGGVGISLPCRWRVATERTRLAMPETGIGLFPDVGGGWYLSRLPGHTGEFLALTGARLDGAECRALGLATHYVASEHVAALVERLAAEPANAGAILDSADEVPGEARIIVSRQAIDRLFAGETLEAIVAELEADGGEWAATERATLGSKSPLSCKVSLKMVRDGRARSDFADEMAAEYALATRVVRTHDFLEGVRALLIDKDNAPDWRPATPGEVDDATIAALFEPLPAERAWTPFPETMA